MLDEKRAREIAKKVLIEEHLDALPSLFAVEHHKHRGTHNIKFSDLADVPDYIDNRQFITIVNEDEDGIAFVDLLGTDHQIVVTKNPTNWVLSADSQFYIHSALEEPRIRVSNLSGTLEFDPILQFGLGSDDDIMFSIGVDDSDSNKLKIANGAVLGGSSGWEFGANLIFGDSYSTSNNRVFSVSKTAIPVITDYSAVNPYTPRGIYNCIYVHTDGAIYICDNSYGVALFDANLDFVTLYTNATFTGASSVYGICYWDGFFYVSLQGIGSTYDAVYKCDPTFTSLTRFLGNTDSGEEDYLFNAKGICTDGALFYVCDNGHGVKIWTVAGVYQQLVSTINGLALTNVWGVQTDGTYLYVCDRGNDRVAVIRNSDLSWVADLDTSGTNVNPWDVTMDEDYIYASLFQDVSDYIRVMVFSKATWSLVSNDLVPFTEGGSAFTSSRGIGILKQYVTVEDLIVLHQDGSYLEVYPVTRFMDDIRLHETALTTSDYVGLAAPAAVTASYTLALPVAAAGATKHLYSDAANQLAFGQDVTPTGSPTFVTVRLTALTDGYLPYHVSDATGLANSNLYHDGNNVGLGQTTFGTSATKTLALSTGVAPSTSPADAFQMYSADVDGVAGKAGVHFRTEDGGIVGIGKARISFQTGIDNYSIGFNCHQHLTTGTGNIAIGYEAQHSLTEGSSNIGIGVDCHYYMTTGSENAAFGQNAQNSLTLGSNNTAFGGGSQRVLSTGSGNTGIGSNTQWVISTGIGNIAAGYGAGTGADFANAPETDDYGILIGYQANRSVVSATKLTNYIGIGYGALIDKSNQVKIGNSSIVETILYGNLGVGGQGTFGTSADKVIAVATGTAPSSSPADAIQFYSADFAPGNACPYFLTENGTLIGLNQDLLTSAEPTWPTIKLTNLTDGYIPYHRNDSTGLNDSPLYTDGTFTGIGTASPDCELHIKKAATTILRVEATGDNLPFLVVKRTGGSTYTNEEWSLYVGTTGELRVYNVTTDKNPIIINASAQSCLYIDANSRLGIGTSSPERLLDVGGTAAVGSGTFIRVHDLNHATTGNLLAGVLYSSGIALPGIWFSTDAPSFTNYALLSDSLNTIINALYTRHIYFRNNNVTMAAICPEGLAIGNAFTFGTSATNTIIVKTGVAPTTSPADSFQNYSADAAAVAGHATPHWRSEAGGIFSIEGGAGTVHEYRYSATLADDAVLTLPFSITNVARGFVAIGDNQERTGFWVDNDGDVVLINNSTNVVANADTDGNLCVGTAAAQEPLQIKNRLGSSLNLFVVMWYN